MSAAKHTPGPWRVGREIGESQLMPRIEILRDVTFVEGLRPTTYYIAEVCYPTTTGNTVGAEERRINAQLIATAPDLLSALRELHRVCASMDLEHEANRPTEAKYIEAMEAAAAAIAKAGSPT